MHVALVLPTQQWVCNPIYVFFSGAYHFAYNSCYLSLPFDAPLRLLKWLHETGY